MNKINRYFSHWQNLIGLGITFVFLLIALFAPILAPVEEGVIDPAFQLSEGVKGSFPLPPDKKAPIGTIPMTRTQHINLWYNLVWGCRSALKFGLSVALFTATLGILIGAISSISGGWLSSLTMRITDAFLAFPVIAGVIFIQQLYNLLVEAELRNAGLTTWDITDPSQLIELGNPYLTFLTKADPLLIALILFSWMPYTRLTYGMVLQIKESDFIHAARALGASRARILLRHLIPNSLSPSIVLAARDIGGVVILQATLTFIGVSGKSEWGEALALGERWIIGPGGNILARWWVFFPITAALVLFGIGWNLLGDGINDWLNPRQI